MRTGRVALLLGGCLLLGLGVGLLLAPALGSDGYSTLVSGISTSSGLPFVVANLLVGAAFLGTAWLRGLPPGVGTVVQVAVVGATVNAVLPLLGEPSSLLARILMLAVAVPVLATGVALYLGSQLGAGPAEAPALAWDPPVPFAVSYSVLQGGEALVGWQLGAAIGPGTVAVTVLLGPVVALVGRLLGLQLQQAAESRHGATGANGAAGAATTAEARHPDG